MARPRLYIAFIKEIMNTTEFGMHMMDANHTTIADVDRALGILRQAILQAVVRGDWQHAEKLMAAFLIERATGVFRLIPFLESKEGNGDRPNKLSSVGQEKKRVLEDVDAWFEWVMKYAAESTALPPSELQ